MTTPLDTVLAYHRAWTSGDVETAMTHVADDATCHAPGSDFAGKQAYTAFLAGFAPSLTGLTDLASMADGDKVTLFYHPHTAATSSAPAAELFTVRDGLIVDNVLVFDRMSYAPPEQP